jgi:hypothetical protein
MKNIDFLLLSFLIIVACESSVDILYEPTQLVLTVLDDRSAKVKGAQVLIFDNEEELNDFKKKGDIAKQKPVLTDDNGQVVFTDLDEKLRYYFFVTYRDRSRFVDLENYNKAFAYPGFLIKGSSTRASIQLEPADNVVVFYSLDTNFTQLPLTIYLDGDSVGIVSQILSQPPSSPNVSGTLSFRLRDGVTNWYGQSTLGCLWTGQFTLGTDDNFTLQELGTCESGAITFWTSDLNTDLLPIKVNLNDGDLFGNLTNISGTPDKCYTTQGLSGSREKGTYTYVATSANGLCTWTGSLTVSKGGCTQIELEKCN